MSATPDSGRLWRAPRLRLVAPAPGIERGGPETFATVTVPHSVTLLALPQKCLRYTNRRFRDTLRMILLTLNVIPLMSERKRAGLERASTSST